MKLILTGCLAFLLSLTLNAQNFDSEDFERLRIRNLGPAGMSGRITAIDVDLSNTNRIFVGSASGGVWKSENGGISWEPIFDDQDVLSIGALKINQSNPAEIWVGTGEGNPRNSHNSGAGIFKTIDGGKSWTFKGLKDTRLIHRIIINEQNSDIVYVGALGSAWGASSERGVFKTTNGGDNWNKILYTNDRTGVADMVGDPTNPNKIIAAMWEFGRTPWDFKSGGKGSGLHITHDGGKNWEKLDHENGLPDEDLGRIGIAIAPSKPNVIYAFIEAKKNGYYRSDDGGENFKLVGTKNIGNRPFYYAETYVDPGNENRIFNLWSYVSMSEDGGKTFKTIMDYGNDIHPDHHAFWISPHDPNYMIDGNDGGLNISRDGGKNWHFVSNIPVGQFYHISVDDDFPYHVYGGMQDNGSWIGPGFALKRGGIRNNDWQELYFGDGFDVQARRDDSRYGYAMSQGGNMAMYDRVTGKTTYIKPNHPEGEYLRFNWNAALALDPFNDQGLYFGSQFVHHSDDNGKSWRIISDDLTTNDTSKQNQHLSGGLTIDATQAENNTTILCIEPSIHDKDHLWVGTDDGLVHRTSNGGDSWTKLSGKLRGLPDDAFIPQIHQSKINANEAFVVANNYRRNDWKPYLYHTKDGGKSFNRIASEQNIDGFVCSVVQDPKEENLIFMGTDKGLYVSFDRGGKWHKWKKGFPSVQIRDMVIQESFDDLVIGTFGRAIWVLDDLESLRQICQSNLNILNKDFAAFDPPIAYMTAKRSYDGIRFSAQSEFKGDNSHKGAVFPIWLKPNEKETKAKKKDEEKMKMYVLDDSGDTIRTMEKAISPGYNVVGWRMSSKNVKFPSRSKEDKEQGGMPILPGVYKTVFEYKDWKDSTEITVKLDPRDDISEKDIEDVYLARKTFNDKLEHATDAFDQLQSARKSMDIVDKLLSFQEDTVKKEMKTLHQDLTKSIDSLELEYMLPKDTKGYQDSSKKLNSLLYRASGFLSRSWDAPGENAQFAIDNAMNKMTEVIDGVNTFFNTDWKAYQEKVEGIEHKLFEDREEVIIK